jgi:1-phosphatidylinositol phosphodiesterase
MRMQHTWSTNWMSGIKDGTKISEISIPGTHDSCARSQLDKSKQCQWFSIIQQLNRGIRFLDIRCQYEAGSEIGRGQTIYFPIYHASAFQHIYFEEVQAQCIAFLCDNPTEFILMNVQIENSGDSGSTGDKFRQKFMELTAPYQAKQWYLKNSIPTIDDCRGRIVLIRAYDADKKRGWANGGGLEWNGFNIDGESSNAIFQTQNGWKIWDRSEKGDKVEKYIKAAEENAARGYLTLNFGSYALDNNPRRNAESMNKRLQKFLGTYSDSRDNWNTALGVIPIDFAGNTGNSDDCLENLIIKHQKHQAANTVYGGIAKWLIEATA